MNAAAERQRQHTLTLVATELDNSTIGHNLSNIIVRDV